MNFKIFISLGVYAIPIIFTLLGIINNFGRNNDAAGWAGCCLLWMILAFWNAFCSARWKLVADRCIHYIVHVCKCNK